VRDDHQAIVRFVVAEFHAAHAELLARVAVKITECRGAEIRAGVRQALQHLLKGQAERKDLLLLHPDGVGLAIHQGQKAETAFARLADGLDLNPLGVEISHMSARTLSVAQSDRVPSHSVPERAKDTMRLQAPRRPGLQPPILRQRF
jgi:hypothetical protein